MNCQDTMFPSLIKKKWGKKGVVIFFPSCHYSWTWQRAELMCWRKAPYARREDYRGALSRNSVCEINWFMLKVYIQIQLILTVVALFGVHFRTCCPQGRVSRLKQLPHSAVIMSFTVVAHVLAFFLLFQLTIFSSNVIYPEWNEWDSWSIKLW